MVGGPIGVLRVKNDSLGGVGRWSVISRGVATERGIRSVPDLSLTSRKRQASMNSHRTSFESVPMPTVASSHRLTAPLRFPNPLQSPQTHRLSHFKQLIDFLQHSGAQKYILRESFNHEDARRDHANLAESVRVYIGGEKFERIDGSVGGLMNGAGKVFQEVPDSHSEVEIERVEVVNFGQVVDVVVLESHSEIQGFKDVGKDVGIVGRIIRDNISGNRSQEDSEMRLGRHNETGVIE